MKLTKSQLQQIIKEELEAYLEEDKDHPGQSCEEAHPGQEHDLYSVTEVSSQKQTDCFDKEDFDSKSRCIANKKKISDKAADAYTAKVLRDMGEIK